MSAVTIKMKNLAFTLTLITAFLAFGASTCRHHSLHKHEIRSKASETSNPEALEENVEEVTPILNGKKKSFDFKTDNSYHLTQVLDSKKPIDNSEKVESHILNELKESSNRESEPDERNLSLNDDDIGFHVKDSTVDYISTPNSHNSIQVLDSKKPIDNSEKVESHILSELKESSNLESEPDERNTLSLTNDGKGSHVKDSTVGYISTPEAHRSNVEGNGAEDVFRMVMKRKTPMKQSNAGYREKVTIIETENLKPLSSKDLLIQSLLNKQKFKARHHHKHHKNNGLKNRRAEVGADSSSRGMEKSKAIEKVLPSIYFVKFDSNRDFQSKHESQRDLDFKRADENVSNDSLAENRSLKTALVIATFLTVLLILVVLSLHAYHSYCRRCEGTGYRKQGLKSVKLYREDPSVNFKGPIKILPRDDVNVPILRMSFERSRPQENFVEELEWQTEAGNWLT